MKSIMLSNGIIVGNFNIEEDIKFNDGIILTGVKGIKKPKRIEQLFKNKKGYSDLKVKYVLTDELRERLLEDNNCDIVLVTREVMLAMIEDSFNIGNYRLPFIMESGKTSNGRFVIL